MLFIYGLVWQYCPQNKLYAMVNFRLICLKLSKGKKHTIKQTNRKDCQGISTSSGSSSEHDSHSLCRAEESACKLITLWSSSVLS